MQQEKVLYWAVRCPVDGFMVALAIIDFDRDGIAHVTWTFEPFLAVCPACGKSQQYGKSEVVMWMGPPPAPEFQPHPAFR